MTMSPFTTNTNIPRPHPVARFPPSCLARRPFASAPDQIAQARGRPSSQKWLLLGGALTVGVLYGTMLRSTGETHGKSTPVKDLVNASSAAGGPGAAIGNRPERERLVAVS